MTTAGLLSLVLAAAPTGSYFFVEAHTLFRAEVELSAIAQSGLVELRAPRVSAIRIPGYVIAHSPGTGDRSGEDLAVACAAEPLPVDGVEPCDLFHVERSGRARPLRVKGLSGLLLPGSDRFAYWTAQMELRARPLDGGDGDEELWATGVLEPRASADGRTIGVASVPGLKRFEPGFSSCPALFLPAAGELRVFPQVCSAQAPFVSATGRALFVSTMTGLASLYVADVRGEVRQLTNVGRTELDGSFLPVPGTELVWLPREQVVFTARYESDELWWLDTRSGRAVPLGPGREPAWVSGEGASLVVAVQRQGRGRRFVRVADGVQP